MHEVGPGERERAPKPAPDARALHENSGNHEPEERQPRHRGQYEEAVEEGRRQKDRVPGAGRHRELAQPRS